MNYGKKKASQKQKKITSKKSMQGKRVGVRLFKALILCVLVLGVVGMVGAGVFAKKILDNTPEVSPEDVKPKEFTTFVYADDGAQKLNVSLLLVPIVYTNQSTKSQRICSTHL